MPELNTPYAEKLEFVRALKEAGKLDTPDEDDHIPLHKAINDEDIELAKLLLDNGANPNIPHTYSNNTPLQSAAINGNFEIFQLLLAHKANPDVVSQRGDTVLMGAVIGGNPQIVASLLNTEPKPDLEQIKLDGLTPLMQASSVEILKMLIQAGSNINAKNKEDGKTALSYALDSWSTQENSKLENIAFLIEHGAQISDTDIIRHKEALFEYAKQCINARHNASLDPNQYNATVGIAILKRYLELYPNDKSQVDNIKYLLCRHDFELALSSGDSQNEALSDVMSMVLELDSNEIKNNQLKNLVLTQYFTAQGYTMEGAAPPLTSKPILEHSHTNPALAKAALDSIGSYAQHSHSVLAVQESISVTPEIKAPQMSEAQALEKYAREVAQAKANIQNDALYKETKSEPVSRGPSSTEKLKKLLAPSVGTINLGDAYKMHQIGSTLKELYNKKEMIPYEVFKLDPKLLLKELQSTITMGTKPQPILQHVQNMIDNYYFEQANDFLRQSQEPNKSPSEVHDLLNQALHSCLALPPNNDFYQNFKEMVFNLYLSNKPDSNIMEPLSPLATEALKASSQGPALSYAVLQAEKQQYDAQLAQQAAPPQQASDAASFIATPVSVIPLAKSPAEPNTQPDVEAGKPKKTI